LDDWQKEFVLIPKQLVDKEKIIPLSSLSDALLCFCASRSTPIPRFITVINSGSNFVSLPVDRIEIPASVRDLCGFVFYPSLQEVQFPVDCQVRIITGFRRCDALRRIEIPASVEIITFSAFCACASLNEIVFAMDGCLREIAGFGANAIHFVGLRFHHQSNSSLIPGFVNVRC
jgi:hypothetical protein